MRVLLDEGVDRRLATDIRGHDVKTVPDVPGVEGARVLLRQRGFHEAKVRRLRAPVKR